MKFLHITLFCFFLIATLATVSEGFRVEQDTAMHHTGEARCRDGEQNRRRGRPRQPPQDDNPPDVPEGGDAENADV